jgi:hypothetical protein
MSGNRKIGPEDVNVVIEFGGGLHTRASADDIDPREAADGVNFVLDVANRDLKPRPPFDLVGTVPNAAEIRGGGSLVKSDGTISTIIQAGDTIYEWDGEDGFTNVGSCVSTAKLRGHHRTHNWTLDDKLLLTDLNLADTVKEWDGTTFASVTFLDGHDSGAAFGTFYAKYLNISDERAIFAHVKDPTTTSRHMIVGSMRSEYTVISNSQRPSSALSEEDPFFLLSPDLKPINGHVEAFGTAIISTERGQLFNLSGSSAKDFKFDPFYAGSAAIGDESLAYVGNDLIYGRQGRVESVTDTDKFGDSANDDLTLKVADQIAGFSGWTTVFNSRLNRAALFPTGQSEVWMLDTALRGRDVSPWMRWRTTHPLAFQPTFVMSLLDPSDGLEYTMMGDASGNLYRLEGDGTDGDGGTSPVQLEFLTRVFTAKLDAKAYDLEGYIRYHKDQAASVELIFEYAGEEIFTKSITVDLAAVTDANYYGGSAYYGGEFYHGSISGRLARRKFHPPASANEFQIRIKVTSTTQPRISSIGVRFKQAS